MMIKAVALGMLLLGATPIQDKPADLTMCLGRYRAGQAHYVATLNWRSPAPGGHLVVGAVDTSRVAWVQIYEGTLGTAGRAGHFQFVVSDVSRYPLKFAVYKLSDEAFRDYKDACDKHQECYFGPADAGVEQLSDEFVVESVATLQSEHPCPTN